MERTWRINCTLLQKLEDTGYAIPDAERQACSSLTAFQQAFTSRQELERIFYPAPLAAEAATEDTAEDAAEDAVLDDDALGRRRNAHRKSPQGVLLFFSKLGEGKKQVGLDEVRRLGSRVSSTGVSTVFVVMAAPFSTSAGKSLVEMQSETFRAVCFHEDELMFNVSRHLYVPRHELLTPAAANRWLQKTKLKRSQIPVLSENDVQARYLDASNGDIIRVTSPSRTAAAGVRHLLVVRYAQSC